ncbi:MAG: hypothetical protein WCA35_09225 [Kovacikia sp.]
MNWYDSGSVPRDALPDTPASVLKGIFLRWHRLEQAEKTVCLGIVLIPLWWLWGWSYLLLALALGIYLYEYVDQGKIQLQNPGLVVLALTAYGAYDLISAIFYGFYHDASLSVRDFTESLNAIFAPAAIIWYVQSRRIRVRPSVVAWSFSVIVLLMLATWIYLVTVAHQAPFMPPRSLFGALTHKPVEYVPGLGNTNYLIPYRAEDRSLPGFVRFFFFFHGPESLALVTGFIALLALDLNKRLWSVLLFSGAVFCLLMSGTRSVWLALPATLLVRWLLKLGNTKNTWLVYALAAFSSFLIMLPPVSDFILDTTSGTTKTTEEFRGDSTEVRAEIYRRTSERILDSSNWELFVGHVVPGETVLPGYAPAMVGTHSFYLGTLLYRQGLLGTGLFAFYWLSLIAWLYKTRRDRPIAVLLVFLLFSLTFGTMAFESVVMPITLICSVTRQPYRKMNPFALTH